MLDMKAILFATLLGTFAMAQNPDAKTTWGNMRIRQAQIKGVLIRSAEKMPETSYGFKPSHDVRSFGELASHVAMASYAFCSAATGDKPAMPDEKSLKTKEDITKALKEALDYCDKAYAGLTDANANDPVKLFGMELTKAGALQLNTAHDFEHYGNMVTYMRIRGFVPPSSEGR